MSAPERNLGVEILGSVRVTENKRKKVSLVTEAGKVITTGLKEQHSAYCRDTAPKGGCLTSAVCKRPGSHMEISPCPHLIGKEKTSGPLLEPKGLEEAGYTSAIPNSVAVPP